MASPLEQLQLLMQLARLRQGVSADSRASEDQALQREAAALRSQQMMRDLQAEQAYGALGAPITGGTPTSKVIQRVQQARTASQYPAPVNNQVGSPDEAVQREVLGQFGGVESDRYSLKKQMIRAGIMKQSDLTPQEKVLFDAEEAQLLQGQMQATEDPTQAALRKSQEWDALHNSYYKEKATELGTLPIEQGQDILDVLQQNYHQKDWMGIAEAVGRGPQMKQRLMFQEKANQLGGTAALSPQEKQTFGFVAEQREKLRESFSVNPEQAPWLYTIGGKAEKEKRTKEFKAYLDAKYADAPGSGFFGLGKPKEYQIELQNWEANTFRPTKATKTAQEGQAMTGKPPTEWYILNKAAEQNQLQELSKFDMLYQYYLNLNMMKAGLIQSSIPSGEGGPPLSPDMLGGPSGALGPQPAEDELQSLEQQMIESARQGNTTHQQILDQSGVQWRINSNPQP